MDRICIDVLFPTESSSKKNHGTIDIKSLFPNDNDGDFSIDEIIQKKRDRKDELDRKQHNTLKTCIRKIRAAVKENRTDMIFSIPIAVPGYPEYDYYNCLCYIEKSLRNMHFDTLKLNASSIFVTWINAEKNKEDYRKNMKKRNDSDSESD